MKDMIKRYKIYFQHQKDPAFFFERHLNTSFKHVESALLTLEPENITKEE